MGESGEGVGGLAKRWLKSKAKEITTSDRHTREHADRDADHAARRLREKGVEEAVLTAVPGLRRLKERQEAAAAEAEAERIRRRHEELTARPRAAIRITVLGAVQGAWSGSLPTRATVVEAPVADGDVPAEPDEWVDPDPYAMRPTLVVDIEAFDDDRPSLGAEALAGWRFQVPGFTGPGTYDLAAIGMERRAADAEPDYLDWDLSFGEESEVFYFQPDTGPSTVAVDPDRRRLDVTMSLAGASGDLAVQATIELPEPIV